MTLAQVFLLAMLGAQQGAFALPTPRHEATESMVSTGCAHKLATAFATVACGFRFCPGGQNPSWYCPLLPEFAGRLREVHVP
eukprot:COSAG02_NODE_5401_length_4361_cov_3.564054_4_plen_82_part_00